MLKQAAAPLLAEFEKPGRRAGTMAFLFEHAEVTNFYERTLRAFAARNKIKLVFDQIFSSNEQDFRAHLTRIKQLAPELLVIGAWPSRGLQILREAKQLDVSPRYLWYISELDA